MKRKLLVILIILICASTVAQKQTAFWYFGNFGGLDFNSGNPIALTDGQLNTNEGCAAISNFNGELLMYTDGVTVWNKNHEIMQNGAGLNGNFSSTNSAIIIPKPDNVGIYYIFTVDDLGGANGLQYSEVDMTLDSNLGGVTTNKNVLLHTPTTEKITAVKHQNDVDWWVLAHKWNSREFTAYLVTSSGVGSPIISDIGTYITGATFNTVGAMKFSPDGRKIAIANSYDYRQVQLFDFNNLTGDLTNPVTLTGFNGVTGNVYGVEFSLDSRLLYASDFGGSIYQYNVDLATSTEIINSRIEIASSVAGLGALQIAPNGKIYVALENQTHLGVINNPNLIGTGSDFINVGISLNDRRSKLGLPPFIQSYFWKEITSDNLCFGENSQFNIVNPEVSQIWDFDDPASGIINNTSTLPNPTHTFTAPGNYTVQVESTNFLGESAITIINVDISETPTATIPTDLILCDDAIDGDAQNGIIQSFILSDKDSEIMGALDTNLFTVFYYEDVNFTQLISKFEPYENTSAYSQLIYAKVFNLNNDTCFDAVEFNLVVNEVPIFDLADGKIVCSNNLPDQMSVENPLGIYDYEWTLDDGTVLSTTETIEFLTVDFIPSDGLTITLTATDPLNNCTTVVPVFIEKFEIATITLNDIVVVDLTDNNTISFNPQDPNIDVNDYVFALDDGLGGIGPYQSEPVFENVAPGIRTVYIKDIYGCDSIEIQVPVIGFRKFFTPNNDGYNDTWHILGVSENFYTASIIHIYDRFGKIVANIPPQSEGWDGYYNNKKLPETDYWFTVQLIDGEGNIRNHKGHFSLIRR
ncbi:MAG: T9SS type B sorting domain-containing protein [Urechidicola sp.]|nr:T9SS type B sorting domain-containing protein [Urechidicola sp.]